VQRVRRVAGKQCRRAPRHQGFYQRPDRPGRVHHRAGLRTRGDLPGELCGGVPAQHFSADDGNTWFADDAAKIPPIDHEGKTAYRVRVFRCPSGREFACHLERFSPDDKKNIEEQIQALTAQGRQVDVARMGVTPTMQVKKPGDKEWLSAKPQSMSQYTLAMQPKCPDGHTEGLEPVYPQ
jgi:hypothetical protein